MPTIILKKTTKTKPNGLTTKTQKAFTFHGSMGADMIEQINRQIHCLRLVETARKITFKLNTSGHYCATMGDEFQKHHEEDAICSILDAMEEMGFAFRFQTEPQQRVHKSNGIATTKQDLFIFHRSSRGCGSNRKRNSKSSGSHGSHHKSGKDSKCKSESKREYESALGSPQQSAGKDRKCKSAPESPQQSTTSSSSLSRSGRSSRSKKS